MRKYIIGFIFGAILFTTIQVEGFRIYSPPNFTDLSDTNQLTNLNNYLEKLSYLGNGKYNFDVVTSVPTWTGKEGDAVAYQDGSNYRLYVYLNSAWRQI